MRDVDRIGKITWKLAQLWQLQQDMRFGQMLENYIYPFGKVDWHLEDNVLEKRIDKAILKVSNRLEERSERYEAEHIVKDIKSGKSKSYSEREFKKMVKK